MKSMKKHSFYPVEQVEKELKDVPRGHISERVNELILKGLSVEKQQEVALAYQNYNAALTKVPLRNSSDSSIKFMSEGAFKVEDEVEDYI